MVLPEGHTLPSTQSGRKSYKSIKHLVKRMINEGHLVAHEQLPPMRTLCETYEISLVTVQRALAELCEENVLYAERGRGTFVAPIERECQRIGILYGTDLSKIQESMFNPILQVIQEYALESGKLITLSQLKKKTVGQFVQADIQDVMRLDCDVLILVNILNLGLIASLRELGTPIIASDLDATDVGVHSVYFDNEVSGFDMTKQLIEDGHKNIWFFGGLEHASPRYDLCVRQRHLGYRLACRAMGIEEGPRILTSAHAAQANMKEQVKRAIEEYGRPSAIVAESAYQPLQILSEFKISVEVASWSNPNVMNKLPRQVKYAAECDFKEIGHQCWDIISKFEEIRDGGPIAKALSQEIRPAPFVR